MSSNTRFEDGILVKRAIWVLCFGTSLRQAILTVRIAKDGAEFLSEYIEAYKWVSKIKNIALRFYFIYDLNDPETWWSWPNQEGPQWQCGNKKSKAVFQFLQCPLHSIRANYG